MRSNTLSVHYKKHSSRKPFPCGSTRCSKAFTEKGNLAKHIREKHSNSPVSKEEDPMPLSQEEEASIEKSEESQLVEEGKDLEQNTFDLDVEPQAKLE
jgi:uncharacterized Zn-finger protein